MWILRKKVEDTKHVLYECEKFSESRNRMVEILRAKGALWPLNESEIISEKYFEDYSTLCKEIFEQE